MALKDYCNTKPFSKPSTCDEVAYNWIKNKETADVLCCLLQKEIPIGSYRYPKSGIVGEQTFDLPASWGELSSDLADYMVFNNGQLRLYQGEGADSIEWTLDAANKQITFSEPLGTASNPDAIEIRYTKRVPMSELLNCDSATVSC